MFKTFETIGIATGGGITHGVRGGDGPPLLLLHGYPQNHVMWHKIVPALAEHFTVVTTDLRGYGDSANPDGGENHEAYAKRAMAQDQVEAMPALGFDRFAVVGHDRGARVGHRMVLDHPARVQRLAVLDIVPTRKMYGEANTAFATDYYHWYFLIQKFDFPERLIAPSAEYYLKHKLSKFGAAGAFTPEALAEYVRCFDDAKTIHATYEDYRASPTIDLEHGADDEGPQVTCPLLARWRQKNAMERHYDLLAAWRNCADDVTGAALPCGHYLAEEAGVPSEDTSRIAKTQRAGVLL